jgi:hypothetical protein
MYAEFEIATIRYPTLNFVTVHLERRQFSFHFTPNQNAISTIFPILYHLYWWLNSRKSQTDA